MFFSSRFRGKPLLSVLILSVITFALLFSAGVSVHAATSSHPLQIHKASSQSSNGGYDVYQGNSLVFGFYYSTCDSTCGNETWFANNIPPDSTSTFNPPVTTGSKITTWTLQTALDTPVTTYFITIGATSDNPNVSLGTLTLTINVNSPAPQMKMPWDSKLTSVTYNGGPHGNGSLNNVCDSEPRIKLSGLDFGMPQNTPVLAVADGTVVYAKQHYDNQLRGVVIIQHANGFMTEYWHLNTVYTSLVGTQIKQGKVIGLSGWSPCSKCKNGKAVHLHLEFRMANNTAPLSPYSPTPYPAHGLTIDGYTAWSLVPYPDNGNAYNYQGTLTIHNVDAPVSTYGSVTGDTSEPCSNTQVFAWYSRSSADRTWVAGDGVPVPSTNIKIK